MPEAIRLVDNVFIGHNNNEIMLPHGSGSCMSEGLISEFKLCLFSAKQQPLLFFSLHHNDIFGFAATAKLSLLQEAVLRFC